MADVRKRLDRRLARLPSVKAAVRAVADDVLDAARTRAATHTDTGELADSLHLETGRADTRVVADDPRAVTKEYGHVDRRTGRPVPGLHVLGDAAADVAGR